MSFGRRNLLLRRIEKFYVPIYLDSSHTDLVKEVISIYESCIGKPLHMLDRELVMQIVGNEKLAGGLIHVMRYFYRPRRPKEPKVEPRKLRLRAFELVNKIYKGFVPSSKRDEFLRFLKKELGIEDELDIWTDEEEELLLSRVKEVTPEDVIKAYNFEVIDTIFTYAKEVTLQYSSGDLTKGYLAKIIAREAKRKGLLYDMYIKDDRLIVKLYGPVEVFGKPTKYGERISDVMIKVIQMLSSSIGWEIWARVQFKRSMLRVLVISGEHMPSIEMHREVCNDIYDSTLEKRIEDSLRSIGFKVIREPEPIVLRTTIMVPDFIIEKDGRRAYLEVAGYWRDKYAEKKALKLIQLAKTSSRKVPIIVLAEEKLRRYLPDIGIPIIYYRSRGSKVIIPYGKLMLEFNRISS